MRQAMLTQIYEITAPEEARSICAIGIDHIGILIGNGEFPRELPLETAATIAADIRPPSKLSALFLTADLSLIEILARKLQPVIVHLGASAELLSPQHAASITRNLPGVPLIRTI